MNVACFIKLIDYLITLFHSTIEFNNSYDIQIFSKVIKHESIADSYSIVQ